MKPSIVVPGSANIDLVLRVPHLPGPGETVAGSLFDEVFGGKGANQAVAAARAGGHVQFLCCVGNDSTTQSMLASYESDGIGIGGVEVRETGFTGRAVILVDDAGENSIAIAAGNNHAVDAAWIRARAGGIASAGMLVLQLEIPTPASMEAIRIARQNHVPVLLNFAPFQEDARELIQWVNILVVNEIEASQLAGIPVSDAVSAAGAAEALWTESMQLIVVSLGSQGVYAMTAAEAWHIGAPQVKAVDTTAAGDTFCGYLAAALAEGISTESALRLAIEAASRSVTRPGAQPSIPRRNELSMPVA